MSNCGCEAGFGHVSPMSEPLVFELNDVTVTKLSVGSMDNNVYLIQNGSSAVLIDAAADSGRILNYFGAANIEKIITTHRHFDHLGALAEVAAKTKAVTICGRPDRDSIEQTTGVSCQAVWTYDVIKIGQYSLGVIGLSGHTEGSIALVLDVPNNPIHIFTGDCLFPGGVGKTESVEHFELLFNDVKTKIFDVFDDETVIHPGHGDDTKLGWERGQLDQWQERKW